MSKYKRLLPQHGGNDNFKYTQYKKNTAESCTNKASGSNTGHTTL